MCKSIFLYVFVAYSMVLNDKHKHCFLVCNLRPKDLDGRFDPSSTALTIVSSTNYALTKRSQTLSNDTCVSRILSAGVWDRLWVRKGLLLRYTA